MTSKSPESLISPKDIRKLLKYASGAPDGDFVEIGVYKGGSAYHLYKLARQQGRELHLFDTFDGMPHFDVRYDIHHEKELMYRHENVICEMFPEAEIYKGVFPDTLPDDLKNVAFCHVDCDQYKSTKDACDYMPERMVKGGILYFDDYNALPGATKAVDDSFDIIELCNGKAIVTVP